MKPAALPVLLTLLLLALAGCGQEASNGTASAPAGVDAASQGAPKPGGVFPPADVDLAFRLAGGAQYASSSDTLSFEVEATNNGKATLTSEGEFPVNVGGVIRGIDGTLDTPPANLDFLRVAFPQPLATGQSVTLPISFNAGSMLGGTVVIDAVQERVSWFSGYGKPVLTIGKFNRCNDAPDTLCGGDGTPVPEAGTPTPPAQ